MPAKRCETGVLWRSTYKGDVEGRFIIDWIASDTGMFRGRFFEEDSTKDPIDIKGSCTEDLLWFVKLGRSGSSPQHFYSGSISEDAEGNVKATGDRFPVTVPLLNAFLVDERHIGRLREPGDWVGEKNQ